MKRKVLHALEVFIWDCFFCLPSFPETTLLLLKTFLQYLVDFHNCISLAKSPAVANRNGTDHDLRGNRTAGALPKGIFSQRSDSGFKVSASQGPDAAASTIQKLETALLSFISQKLKTWSSAANSGRGYPVLPVGTVPLYQKYQHGSQYHAVWMMNRYGRSIVA